MLAKHLLAAAGNAAEQLYVDDVFSTWLYAGNGGTQTVTNGVNLSGEGGMVWTKCRDIGYSHQIMDTARGVVGVISSDLSGLAIGATDGITAYLSSGYSIGARGQYNDIGSFVSWTFRQASSFFDVVTYTGNGANRTIAHNLGVAPGCIFVKRTDTTGDWQVYHRSLANTDYLVLNNTAASATGTDRWNSTTATASVFSLGTATDVNANGGTFVAYLFAHDTATDGLIQCGAFTTDVNGISSVTLGWEPQWVLYKSSDQTSNWRILDSMRGMPVNTDTKYLQANTADAESSAALLQPSATGFYSILGGSVNPNTSYIYIAIRRPNKPPTVGTEVFAPATRTGTGATGSTTAFGEVTDLAVTKDRSNSTLWAWTDRLRGATLEITSTGTNVESVFANDVTGFDSMTGFLFGTGSGGIINTSAVNYIDYFFRRAPGVFDVVCDTGTGANHDVSHNLGVVPELIIRKGRSGGTAWQVYSANFANTQYLVLNTTAAVATGTTRWNSTTPTATTFRVGTDASVNTNGATYVSYLFATKAGISKVGTYTGNGSSLTVDCGFTTGARFILIKRTNTTGDWFVWDTARGIVAGNDPYSRFNLTNAEVTSNDSIDPDTSGFIVNQNATSNINVNASTYLFLAIA